MTEYWAKINKNKKKRKYDESYNLNRDRIINHYGRQKKKIK